MSMWNLQGEECKDPHHYKGCGLDDIYLLSGYEISHGPHGRSITIKNLDGLHQAIGEFLVTRKKLLTGKEIRFLRNQLDLTQSDLARLTGCDAQTIARYEKGESKISGPSDRLLRMIYRAHFSEDGVQVRNLLEALDKMDGRLSDVCMFESSEGEWKAAA
jgi:putative transcriptional regulator